MPHPNQTQAIVDQALVKAIPALRPLLGRRVRITPIEPDEPQPDLTERRISADEFLAHRLKRPGGVAAVSLEEIDRSHAPAWER